MVESFIIILRESLEAFLIVAIMVAYLKKTDRPQLIPTVYYGIAASIVASLGMAYVLIHAANDKVYEGAFAIVAAILVLSLTTHMIKAGKHLSSKIKTKIDNSAGKIGIFAFTVVMITREGMEIVIMMKALVAQTEARLIVIGAIFGLIGAVIAALAWVKYSHKINIKLFMQATAIFLVMFSVHLFLYGVHELVEAGVLNIGVFNAPAEAYSGKSAYVQAFKASIVGIPLAWIALHYIRKSRNSKLAFKS